MSGGVRNLRAMFETKGEALGSSPPENRGRSPGASSMGGASNGTSPRPLSKVRTSFVTVERTGGGIGLKRENSGEPSMSKRRTSFSIDEEDHPKETLERKESIASEYQARKNSSVIQDTIPESAIETPTMELDKRLGEKANHVKAEEKKAPSNGHRSGTKPAAKTDKPTTAKTISKPAAISTAKTATAARVSPKKIKTPLPKTPTTPVKSQAPMKTPDKKLEKQPEKQPEKKPSRASLAPTTKPASKASTSAAQGAGAKTRIPPSPPQTGFVKPRPKSPTRPIKLPASLTAHTASSGSKTATAPPTNSRQSLSRASGNIQPTNSLQVHQAISRSPSRASTTSKSTLTRKPSTLKPRPSVGPPPALKKQSSRQSLPAQSAPADEGFLARMMRPTTSSASKTAEKPPSPKRAQAAKRPVTRDGPPKMATPVASPAAKVIAPKAAPKEARPATPKVVAAKKDESKVLKQASVAKKEAPAAPKTPVEVPEAEVAKSVEDSAPIEEVKPKEPELSKFQEPRTPIKEETVVKEEPVAVEETPAPVVDEPAVSPPVSKVEAPVTPVEEERQEFSAPITKEPEVAKAEPILKARPEPTKEEPTVVSNPEPTTSEPNVEQNAVVPEKIEKHEDPEDVRAREEIARLNAEVMKGSAEED